MTGLQITIVIGVLVTTIAYILMFKYAKSLDQPREKNFEGKSKKAKTSKKASKMQDNGRQDIEEKIGIKEITNNLIVSEDDAISVVLEYSTPDIPSLKSEEVDAYENGLIRTAIALRHPIKVIEYAAGVKTVKANSHILTTIGQKVLTNETNDYARRLYDSLGQKQYDQNEVEKKKYIVLGAKEGNYESSVKKIKSHVEMLVTNLSRAKVTVNLLDTTKNIDLIHSLIDSGSRLDTASIEESGNFELIATGSVRRTL